MGSSRRILIVGCGYVGTQLGRELAAKGHVVFGARRDPSGLPTGIVPVTLDIATTISRDAVPREIDSVVYCVGAGGFSESAYQTAYVDGLRRIIDALFTGGEAPERLVFLSSTAVYGQQDGERVDESSRAAPVGFSGALLLEGEGVALGAARSATVLRLAGIYGPGRTRMIDAVRSGRARLPRTGGSIGNRIHRDDCAGAIAHLLELDAPESLYVGVDREPATERDVLCWIAQRLGMPMPPETDDGPEALAADTRSRRPRSNKRCSSDRLVASRYTFVFPTFREGYGALIAAQDQATQTPASR